MRRKKNKQNLPPLPLTGVALGLLREVSLALGGVFPRRRRRSLPPGIPLVQHSRRTETSVATHVPVLHHHIFV